MAVEQAAADMAQARGGRFDPKLLGAFLASDVGREVLRRELVEGAGVKAGQQALLLADVERSEAAEYEVTAVAAMLRELGLTVRVLAVEELMPAFPGSVPVAFVNVSHRRLPGPVFEAVRAAEVTFNLSRSRGGLRYNIDFFTLTRYYDKHVEGARTIEAPEVMGSGPAGGPNLEAILYPSDLLRAICDRVNEDLFPAAHAREEMRLTNPWGTDIRFTALPDDISQQQGGIREYPRQDPPFKGEDSDRLYRPLAGVNVPQTCDGVWVTKFCSVVGGVLPEPMRITLKDGAIVGAEGGGGKAERLMYVLRDETVAAHAILMGLNPKVKPVRNGEFILDNNGAGAGLCHIGIGGPGLFYRNGKWGPLGNKHFGIGSLPRISWRAGERLICDDGRLLALEDAGVREIARKYGDPDELLRQFDWNDVPI